MTEGGATTTYTYDKNNRLLEQVVGGTQKKFNYDDRGNLYSKTISVLTATDADAKANTLKYSDDSTSLLFEYDGFNRLNKASSGGMTAEYQYNAEGIRTSKTVNGDKIDFVLDGVNVIAEIRPDGDVTNYVRGLTGIIYRKTKDGTKTYYVKNNHGDVTKLVNSSGVVIKSYNYNEFGIESNVDKTDTNPFRYCGEYYDNETGLIYLRARYYDMTIGRFISEDPVRDQLNWYAYCNGNPLNFADMLGLVARKLSDLVGETTGSIKWDGDWGMATVNIDGTGITYYVTERGVYAKGKLVGYIEDGHIIVDDQDFNKDYDIVGEIRIYSGGNVNGYGSSGVNISGHSLIAYQGCTNELFDVSTPHQTVNNVNSFTVSTWVGRQDTAINRPMDAKVMGSYPSYGKKITENQRNRMLEAIKLIPIDWTAGNTCAAYAVKVFEYTTGIDTYGNDDAVQYPATLMANILEMLKKR